MRSKSRNKNRLRYRQRGAALMAMVLIIFIAASAMFIRAVQPPSGIDLNNQEAVKEMVRAKEMLIAFATNYAAYNSEGDGPGRLPCPAYGDIEPYYYGCNWKYALRLPEFAVLDTGSKFVINDYYSDLDLQFWYSVSPRFRWHSAPPTLNSSNSAELTLDGDAMVAVIIAPGPALPGQDRSASEVSGNDYGADEYLEDDNELRNTGTFVSGVSSNPEDFNDIVIGITHSEIMTPVTARVAKEIKVNLDIYHPGNADSYPLTTGNFDTAMGGAVGWYTGDQWDDETTYTYLSDNSGTLQFQGCAIVYTLNFATGITWNPLKC